MFSCIMASLKFKLKVKNTLILIGDVSGPITEVNFRCQNLNYINIFTILSNLLQSITVLHAYIEGLKFINLRW